MENLVKERKGRRRPGVRLQKSWSLEQRLPWFWLRVCISYPEILSLLTEGSQINYSIAYQSEIQVSFEDRNRTKQLLCGAWTYNSSKRKQIISSWERSIHKASKTETVQVNSRSLPPLFSGFVPLLTLLLKYWSDNAAFDDSRLGWTSPECL